MTVNSVPAAASLPWQPEATHVFCYWLSVLAANCSRQCCCDYFPVLVSRGHQCSFYSWLVSYTCWRAVGRGHYSYSGLFRYSCLLRSRRRGHLQSGKVSSLHQQARFHQSERLILFPRLITSEAGGTLGPIRPTRDRPVLIHFGKPRRQIYQYRASVIAPSPTSSGSRVDRMITRD